MDNNMNMNMNININHLDLNTGDICLFQHVNNYRTGFQIFDNVLSWLIDSWTHSTFSHIGIVIKSPHYRDGKKLEGLFLLESNYEGFPDSEDNEIKFGVQIVPLKKAFENNYSNIYWRKLNCQRNTEFYRKLDEIQSVIHNKPYDINPIDWIKAAFKIDAGDVQKTSTFWCSALVSYVYVKLGFLDENIPWSIISPEQFSSVGEDALTFKNCSLEKETLIFKV